MNVKGDDEHMYGKNEAGYYKNRHSCFLLSYHLVLVTKYRRPVLDGAVRELVYSTIQEILKERGCILTELNGEPDHVHVLFDAEPEINLLDLVRVIKTKTSRFAKSRCKEAVAKFYWKPAFWSDSYFVVTVGENTKQIVQEYIKRQSRG